MFTSYRPNEVMCSSSTWTKALNPARVITTYAWSRRMDNWRGVRPSGSGISRDDVRHVLSWSFSRSWDVGRRLARGCKLLETMAEASGGRTAITPLRSVKLLIPRLDEMEEMAELGLAPYKTPYTSAEAQTRFRLIKRIQRRLGGGADRCLILPPDLSDQGRSYARSNQA
jgi:hypothetical protein